MFELALLVALFEEQLIPLFDVHKAFHKEWLVNVDKEGYEYTNFLSAWRLWPGSQIAANDGLLMEDAELNGRGWKQPLYEGNRALATIDGDAGEPPSLCMQMMQSLLHYRQRFALDFLPVNVASLSTVNHQTIPAPEEGSIERQGDWFIRNSDTG